MSRPPALQAGYVCAGTPDSPGRPPGAEPSTHWSTAPLHQLELVRTLHLTPERLNLLSYQPSHTLLVIHTALLQPDDVFPAGSAALLTSQPSCFILSATWSAE